MQDFFRPDPLGVGTKGLVFIGNDTLIYRRDNKADKYPLHLDVPGGGKEGDETPFETFRREVYEEFRLNITESDIVYFRRYPSIFEEGKFGWYAVVKLPAKVKSQIVMGEEGIDYSLMPLEEFLKKQDAWPVYQQRAADYLKFISSAS